MVINYSRLPPYVAKSRQFPESLILLSGLANITKPLTRLVINLLTGWPFSSFRFGVAYPVASHLFYGAFGGLLGALIIFGVNRLSAKK